MKTLSSAQTLYAKFVFPSLWIFFFGVGTLSVWLGAGQDRNGAPPEEKKVDVLAMWIAGTLFILWGCAGLKRVRLDAGHLYISNYWREIAVPLTLIADVTENRWINLH